VYKALSISSALIFILNLNGFSFTRGSSAALLEATAHSTIATLAASFTVIPFDFALEVSMLYSLLSSSICTTFLSAMADRMQMFQLKLHATQTSSVGAATCGNAQIFPLVGRWVMSAVVEADEKGRILLPIEMRRKFGTRRFKVSAKDDHLELEPLATVEELKGKYRSVIKSEWEELEEKAEHLVSQGRR
jgi:bifunctional DNA-binding transcriptional regulator/antitoxin component of YhaV-PrlF toxin-antitoxin module